MFRYMGCYGGGHTKCPSGKYPSDFEKLLGIVILKQEILIFGIAEIQREAQAVQSSCFMDCFDTGMMIFWAAAAQLVTFLLGHESGGIRVVIDHRRLTTGILASGHLLVIETHQRGRHLRVSKSGQGGSKTDSIVITSLMARAPANLRVEVRREK